MHDATLPGVSSPLAASDPTGSDYGTELGQNLFDDRAWQVVLGVGESGFEGCGRILGDTYPVSEEDLFWFDIDECTVWWCESGKEVTPKTLVCCQPGSGSIVCTLMSDTPNSTHSPGGAVYRSIGASTFAVARSIQVGTSVTHD